jgi:hypothetical protein
MAVCRIRCWRDTGLLSFPTDGWTPDLDRLCSLLADKRNPGCCAVFIFARPGCRWLRHIGLNGTFKAGGSGNIMAHCFDLATFLSKLGSPGITTLFQRSVR